MSERNEEQAVTRALSVVVAQLLGALPNKAWAEVMDNAATDLGQADHAAQAALAELEELSATWRERHHQQTRQDRLEMEMTQ
jgi:hypothetical protein